MATPTEVYWEWPAPKPDMEGWGRIVAAEIAKGPVQIDDITIIPIDGEKNTTPTRAGVCIVCKTEFIGYVGALTCSTECWRQHNRDRAKQVKLQEPRKVCVVCGEKFTGREGRKTCSETCAIQKRKALVRHSGASISGH